MKTCWLTKSGFIPLALMWLSLSILLALFLSCSTVPHPLMMLDVVLAS